MGRAPHTVATHKGTPGESVALSDAPSPTHGHSDRGSTPTGCEGPSRKGKTMKRFITGLAVISTLAAAAVAAPSASAAAHASSKTASNGRIVFRRWLNGNHTRGEIFTINPN